MARVGIIFGLILCGITVAGLIGTPIKNPTQFYGMMLGIPILFCGVVALNPHRRRVAMMVAAGIALSGAALGALWASIQYLSVIDGEGEINRYSLRLIAGMTAVCLTFLACCVYGFSRIRKRTARRMTGAKTVPLPPVGDAERRQFDTTAVDNTLPHDPDVPTSREIA